MAMRGLTNNFGTEKYEIIRERCYERGAIRIRIQHKSKQQERGENPGEPFDFYRQNKKDVNDLVGIKSCKGKEQRRDEHAVRKIAAEEKRRNRCADHSDKEIKCKPERAPCAFETFADEPEKPQSQHDPKTERLRNEDISDQPPDFPMPNARRIEIEGKTKIRI